MWPGSLFGFAADYQSVSRPNAAHEIGTAILARPAAELCMGQVVEFATNHPFLVAGLLAAWAAVMFYELRLKSASTTHVSAADAVRLINKGALVIDVRKAEEYQAGHIVNSRNIEIDKIVRDEDAVNKQKNKVLLTVCTNGASSGRAATLLRKAGYPTVFSLKGGLSGWRAENLPLVK
jgi:rhodanese-related sulfurtransferase